LHGPDLEGLNSQAEALVARKDFLDAARVYARMAQVCQAADYTVGVVWAWQTAGECWRRADHPVASVRALRRALEACSEPSQGDLARVRLGGALVEVARLSEAVRLLRPLCEGTGPARVPAVDTLIGVYLAMGRVAPARRWWQHLSGEEPGVVGARAFRAAQIARLDGDLDGAGSSLRQVESVLGGLPGGETAVAAARAERAEIQLMRGEFSTALELLEQACAGQEAAGREGLRGRANTARVRAMVEAGLTPLPGQLDPVIRLASTRAMRLLEVDARLARGMARAERDPAGAAMDLRAAAQQAEALGSVHRAGRCRLELATRVPATVSERLTLLEVASRQLATHQPLSLAVGLARAEVLAQADPKAARRLALEILPALLEMGLAPRHARARALLDRLA
jgi:hypothetical protein